MQNGVGSERKGREEEERKKGRGEEERKRDKMRKGEFI